MNDDNNFFLKQMRGVKPLKKNNKFYEKKTKRTENIKQRETLKLNKINTKKHKSTVSENLFNLEKSKIKKNLKKRTIRIDKKIDFHGRGLLEAEEIFINTISECYNKGQRCLLFVTGKGLFKSKNIETTNQPKLYHGVIRSELINWVNSKKYSKYILSFEQASIEHGGDGAFYTYLRKNKN